MDYQKVRQTPGQFLSLTSLTIEKFDYLLPHFETDREKYYRYHTLEGKKRQILSYQEHGNATLKGTPTKLFFLLIYLKTNNLQQYQAAVFRVSQGKISRIGRILLSVLDNTLKRIGFSPVRNGFELKAVLATHPNQAFTYDGIERGILRNSDQEAQENEFSGKKSHHLKNNVLCDDCRLIYFLSATESGSMHDKAIADEYPIELPLNSVLRQDLGFLGHSPGDITIEQPHRRSNL